MGLDCGASGFGGSGGAGGTLTSASTAEQASAGLTQLSQAEVFLFQQFNKEYRKKFGFPFVICARLEQEGRHLSAFPQRSEKLES